MAPATEKVTEEQANTAFQQLVSGKDESETAKPAEAEPAAEEAAPAAEVKEAEAEEETQEVKEPESDDVQSLKKRLEEIETRAKDREQKYESRLKAKQQRFAENERILRERYLRKSTAADKALRVLKAAKTEAGVEPSEADRVIAELEATMHPASASYAPPEQPTAAHDTEDHALVINRFLNEMGMDEAEADTFGKWIKSEAASVLSPSEQAVANESLDGFLRIAHVRWQLALRENDKQQKVDDAVAAVKSVQRTQRQAAKAAETTSGAPKKQPTKQQTEVDVRKLTKADISRLVRQSYEQYT